MSLRSKSSSALVLVFAVLATSCSDGNQSHRGDDVSAGGLSASEGGTATVDPTLSGGVSSAGGSSSKSGSTSSAPGGNLAMGGSRNIGGSSAGLGCGSTSLPADCNSTGTGPCTIDVNGLSRQFFVVLPAAYDPMRPYPVVFAWHYFNGTAAFVLSGWNGPFYGVQAGLPNAIYIAPQGLPATAGGTDYGWANTNGQDVDFARDLITWAETNYCVDESRLFSVGMSYGGMMSGALGCLLPDMFRAIGVMSGSLSIVEGQVCVEHPIAAFITHGDADTTVDIAGAITARDMFIENNGCDTTNTQSVVIDAHTTCTLYNVCAAGNYPVEWCPVTGGGHGEPSWEGVQLARFFAQF